MVLFFLTLYLSRVLGFSADWAGVVMSGYGVGMLGGALVGGTLSDRLGAFRVQRIVLTASGVLLCSLPLLVAILFWCISQKWNGKNSLKTPD